MPKLAHEDLETRRRSIVAAAIRAFARTGLHATTMRDIFKEAGLSAGAVYNYFQSKEDIILAVVEANSDASVAALEGFAATERTPEAFMRLVDVFFEDLPRAGADGRARMAQMIAAEASVSATLGATLRERRAQIRNIAAEHLAQVAPQASEVERTRLLAFVFHLYEGMLSQVAVGESVDVEGMRAIVDHVLSTYPGSAGS